MVNNGYEAIDNLDDSIDFKYSPGGESATIAVVGDSETINHISDTMAIAPGSWTCSGYTRDKQSVQLSSCGIVNKPSVDSDGAIELEIRSIVRWA